jgi:hypothetical protein
MGIGEYIKAIYIYGVGIVGILATIVIMIGGLIWISSMGNAARVTEAKDWIGAALTGLALAMFSYMILWIINPNLVGFSEINPKKVEVIKNDSIGKCSNINTSCDFTTCCPGLICDARKICSRNPATCLRAGTTCGPNSLSCCDGNCTNGVCPNQSQNTPTCNSSTPGGGCVPGEIDCKVDGCTKGTTCSEVSGTLICL